jgi:hypothetical protein
MGKRRADADGRRFFDEFKSVRVSRFRAMGVIDPANHTAVIPFPNGTTKLIGTQHVRFPNGGGWSFFVCPKCARRAVTLYLIDDAPLCWRCCDAINIKHVGRYAFGREARRKAKDRALDVLIAKLETKEPLLFKPAPSSWRGKAQQVYRSQRLHQAMRRRLIELRLEQLAYQDARACADEDDTLVTHQPVAEARQLIDISSIWRANTAETLQQALDNAQIIILAALDSDDPQRRLNAAKLLMRTKQARDRGLV